MYVPVQGASTPYSAPDVHLLDVPLLYMPRRNVQLIDVE